MEELRILKNIASVSRKGTIYSSHREGDIDVYVEILNLSAPDIMAARSICSKLMLLVEKHSFEEIFTVDEYEQDGGEFYSITLEFNRDYESELENQ